MLKNCYVFQGLKKPFDYRYEGYQKPGRGTKLEKRIQENKEKRKLFLKFWTVQSLSISLLKDWQNLINRAQVQSMMQRV